MDPFLQAGGWDVTCLLTEPVLFSCKFIFSSRVGLPKENALIPGLGRAQDFSKKFVYEPWPRLQKNI